MCCAKSQVWLLVFLAGWGLQIWPGWFPQVGAFFPFYYVMFMVEFVLSSRFMILYIISVLKSIAADIFLCWEWRQDWTSETQETQAPFSTSCQSFSEWLSVFPFLHKNNWSGPCFADLCMGGCLISCWGQTPSFETWFQACPSANL